MCGVIPYQLFHPVRIAVAACCADIEVNDEAAIRLARSLADTYFAPLVYMVFPDVSLNLPQELYEDLQQADGDNQGENGRQEAAPE